MRAAKVMFILALVAIFAVFAQASALTRQQRLSQIVENKIGRLTLHSDAQKIDLDRITQKIDLDKIFKYVDAAQQIVDIFKNEEFSDAQIRVNWEKVGDYLEKANDLYVKINAVRDVLASLKKSPTSLSDRSIDLKVIDEYLNKAERIIQILKSEEAVAMSDAEKIRLGKVLNGLGKVAEAAGHVQAIKGVFMSDAEKFKIKKALKKVGKVAVKGAKLYATSQGIPAGLLSKRGLKQAAKGQLKEAAINAAKGYARKHGVPLADAEKFKIKKALKKVGKVAVKGAKLYATSQGVPAGLLSKRGLKQAAKGQLKQAAVNAAKDYARKHGIPLADAEKIRINWKKVGKTALKVGKIYATLHGVPIPLSE